MRFYRFKVYDGKRTLTRSLPFTDTREFFRYLKRQKLKLISYGVTRRKYSLKERDILLFTQHLISLIDSGIGITLSLEIIASQEKDPFSHIITTIKNDIQSGESIHSSFARYNQIFNDTFLNLLNAGEKSGNLSGNLKRIHENLKLVTSIKNKVKKAVFYPAIVGFFTLCLLIFLFIFILPEFEDFFEGSGVELPFLTALLLKISRNFIPVSAMFITLIIITAAVIRILPEEHSEKLPFKIPVLKGILYKNLIINFTQNFYIMLESGMSVPDTLEALKINCRYRFFRNYIDRIQRNIQYGYSVHDAFASVDFFNIHHLKLINIGEQTGRLAQTFETISVASQKQLEEKLFRLTTLLQPALLTLLGVIIGIIIIAIYLPVFSMSDVIL